MLTAATTFDRSLELIRHDGLKPALACLLLPGISIADTASLRPQPGMESASGCQGSTTSTASCWPEPLAERFPLTPKPTLVATWALEFYPPTMPDLAGRVCAELMISAASLTPVLKGAVSHEAASRRLPNVEPQSEHPQPLFPLLAAGLQPSFLSEAKRRVLSRRKDAGSSFCTKRGVRVGSHRVAFPGKRGGCAARHTLYSRRLAPEKATRRLVPVEARYLGWEVTSWVQSARRSAATRDGVAAGAMTCQAPPAGRDTAGSWLSGRVRNIQVARRTRMLCQEERDVGAEGCRVSGGGVARCAGDLSSAMALAVRLREHRTLSVLDSRYVEAHAASSRYPYSRYSS